MPLRVGAVVLHYRRWPDIDLTVRALRGQRHPLQELVVVDNASRDGSTDRLRARHPDLELLCLPVNVGYGAGMNEGAQALLSRDVDALLFVTHECVLEERALGALVAHLEGAPEVAAVGPLLCRRSAPETVFSAGGWFDARTGRWGHHVEPREAAAWAELGPREVDWLDGAAVLMRREAFLDVGGFEERFFLYFEDLALGQDLRRRGWQLACVPGARAWQESSSPEQAFTELWVRNQLLVMQGRVRRRTLFRRLTRLAASAVASPVRGRGVADGVRRGRGVLRYLIRR